jgi:bifunctional non-homologous end joining protein LigD
MLLSMPMPLDWSQVRAGLDPRRFTMVTAPALLTKGKPWAGNGDAERPLAAAIKKLVGPRRRQTA